MSANATNQDAMAFHAYLTSLVQMSHRDRRALMKARNMKTSFKGCTSKDYSTHYVLAMDYLQRSLLSPKPVRRWRPKAGLKARHMQDRWHRTVQMYGSSTIAAHFSLLVAVSAISQASDGSERASESRDEQRQRESSSRETTQMFLQWSCFQISMVKNSSFVGLQYSWRFPSQ